MVLPTRQDEASYQEMWERFKLRRGVKSEDKAAGPAYALPTVLLPSLSWSDVLRAIEHEEGGTRLGIEPPSSLPVATPPHCPWSHLLTARGHASSLPVVTPPH